ncbi:hypothetical protein GDO78_017386 [Eleutherodactylus coqui]|uniref:Uncharacterized protein n=1 Tax=Eleutherodactylus coqui TaxID=57060 RepID=A0A8J6EA48_ELECQ|nr:hypothetical protein GDO78_017386 [Eleutherodactylus coqui]
MPDPTQQPPPNYAEVATVPAYPPQYYPNQVAPGPQPVVYQPVQYAVPVVTVPPVMGAGLGPTYDDYMCWSIVSLLCCCLPIGVAALIFSCKTQDANARQDLNSARSYSSTARTLNLIAVVLGVLSYIFISVFMFMRPKTRY